MNTVHLDSGPRRLDTPLCGRRKGATTPEIRQVTCGKCIAAHDTITATQGDT